MEQYIASIWPWFIGLSWEDRVKLAPLGTMLVALVAAIVAIVSLRTQVGIARRRAAIDIFLKTEMDQTMLKAYRDYEKAIELLPSENDIEAFSKAKPDEYMSIRTYLDINELICIGINQKAFDERVCYGFWYNILNVACAKGARVIQHARKPHDGGHTYDQLLRVHKRWVGIHWPWQMWRR